MEAPPLTADARPANPQGSHPREINTFTSTVRLTIVHGRPHRGQTVARRLFPDLLPYRVGTPATYGFAAFNGRTLADNAPEAMLSLVATTAVPSGLKPSVAGHRTRSVAATLLSRESTPCRTQPRR
jgi:hypothetical protein